MADASALPPIVYELSERLAASDGIVAVALGGSRARGTARADSDYDLGVYYRETAPFDIERVRALATELTADPDVVVTDFWRWGPWVNGGAWLTVENERVDLLYRCLEHLERVIDDCRHGKLEWHAGQQPPFGFFSHAYLGELSICRPLVDPEGVLSEVKQRIASYPPALRTAVLNGHLWGCEFDLRQSRVNARREDVYNTASTLARIAARLVQTVYALNQRYFVGDKGALGEIDSFPTKPAAFRETIEAILASPGADAAALIASVGRLAHVVEETIALAGASYRRPAFAGV